VKWSNAVEKKVWIYVAKEKGEVKKRSQKSAGGTHNNLQHLFKILLKRIKNYISHNKGRKRVVAVREGGEGGGGKTRGRETGDLLLCSGQEKTEAGGKELW